MSDHAHVGAFDAWAVVEHLPGDQDVAWEGAVAAAIDLEQLVAAARRGVAVDEVVPQRDLGGVLDVDEDVLARRRGEAGDQVRDGEALEAWRTYHLISDSLRDTRILSSGFSARFAGRMALEPTILSPASIPQHAAKRPYYRAPLSAAASFAAVALVGWLAFQAFGPQGQQTAQNKAQDSARAPVAAIVPMPGELNDYLLAHQNYSPRSALQGVAPYVRTVSDSARPR